KLGDDALEQELCASKHAIEDAIGTECTTFAYPFGLHDARVRAAVERAGYKLAFAWTPGPWDRFAAPRLAGPPRHGPTRLALKMLGVRRRGG
ncbi:MAG: polysaccharide deacetylase family protein, partial [Actinomycetota bacterium]|nr:polysaccharide deacetylase family protein [Actinomycetota bacterium]